MNLGWNPGRAGRTRSHRPRAAVLLVIISALGLIVAAAPPAAAALPTGTYTPTAAGGQCWPGFTCTGFRVACPGLEEPATGDIARRVASGARGTLVFFQAGGGSSFVPEGSSTKAFMDDMHAADFTLVQVRWDKPWYKSALGESAGVAKVACRPVTVVKWIEQNIYVEKSHSKGACGFCLAGASGGASAISYATAFYGLDSIIDALILAGGPPHAALAKGCLGTGGPGYPYAAHTARNIDDSYGYPVEGGGPCEARDPSFTNRWNADSVESGGSDYVHSATRFTFLIGSEDNTVGPAHGMDYADKLNATATNMVFVKNVAGMPHGQWATSVGIEALKDAVFATGGSGGSGSTGGSGSSGGSSGSGGSGRGGGGTPAPTATPTQTVPASPTTSPTATSTATDAPGIALPEDEDSGGFPATALLLLAAPVVALILYHVLRGGSLIPGRRRPGG